MIGACLVIWCLGTATFPTETRVIATQDVYNKETGIRTLLIGESAGLVGGYIYQNDTRDAVFIGGLPIHIQMFHPRVRIDAGALVASAPIPRRGTQANWIARLQVRATEHVALEFVHISNGGVRNVPNPAIDSLGLSVKLW